jgi:hypothetical protein
MPARSINSFWGAQKKFALEQTSRRLVTKDA